VTLMGLPSPRRLLPRRPLPSGPPQWLPRGGSREKDPSHPSSGGPSSPAPIESDVRGHTEGTSARGGRNAVSCERSGPRSSRPSNPGSRRPGRRSGGAHCIASRSVARARRTDRRARSDRPWPRPSRARIEWTPGLGRCAPWRPSGGPSGRRVSPRLRLLAYGAVHRGSRYDGAAAHAELPARRRRHGTRRPRHGSERSRVRHRRRDGNVERRGRRGTRGGGPGRVRRHRSGGGQPTARSRGSGRLRESVPAFVAE